MTKPDDAPVDSAVLVPVHRGVDGEPRLVLVRRGEGGFHSGQLAFPGGKRDPHDSTMLDTALREAWEEIGLPRTAVEILARLPATETLTTGFRIFPFLARIVPPRQWRRDEREIAEVIELRLADLTCAGAHGEELKQLPAWPEPRLIPFYRVGNHRLWGATYRIIHPLIPRLLGGEWDL